MKREDAPEVDEAVAAIIADVRDRGDAAVLELTERFDRMALTPIAGLFGDRDRRGHRAGPGRGARGAGAGGGAHPGLSRAPVASGRAGSTTRARRWAGAGRPVAAAGLYVPGGLASYPSSVLMNAIPAQVAGVERLVICAPTPDGVANPLVLLAARLSGVDTVYRIGGAQAVAAMAYGTETIAPVDKITGPGNAYVAAAKRRVFGKVGIDMIAGPVRDPRDRGCRQ
jgi:histidinol dehydrogenase